MQKTIITIHSKKLDEQTLKSITECFLRELEKGSGKGTIRKIDIEIQE